MGPLYSRDWFTTNGHCLDFMMVLLVDRVKVDRGYDTTVIAAVDMFTVPVMVPKI